MTELITTINEIVKYGLQPNLTVSDKEKLLERNLVKIYDLYFCIKYEFDETDFPDFDTSHLPDIRKNVSSNFKDYGFESYVLRINICDKYPAHRKSEKHYNKNNPIQ